MVLLCLSDVHGAGAGIADLLASAPAIDLIVLAGDLTHLGDRDEAALILDPLLARGVRLLAVPGNMDRPGVTGLLADRGVLLHGRGVVVGGVGFLGLGGSSTTPFGTPFELADDEAARLLAEGWKAAAGAAVRVLVSHAPPRGTRIDRTAVGLHAGSAAVRRFLEEHPVELCVCGHIHEAAGEEVVGTARCLNVGAFKNGRSALVTIGGGAGRPRIEIDRRDR